jgi:amino acid transporter
MCYAALISAMPRAGGSYVNVSRALNPFAGFIASFSQWFGLCMAMGVVAYFLVPVLRDLLTVAGFGRIADLLDLMVPRLWVSLIAIWVAWLLNFVGVRFYERSMVIMASVTIVAPIIITGAGVLIPHHVALQHLQSANNLAFSAVSMPGVTPATFLGTAVTLFSSFIGFDAVAQAAGEAKHPPDLARAIMIAIAGVTIYYVCFTWSVYRAIPAAYIYRVSLVHDISAPGLMAPLLPRWLSFTILASVAIAILKVLPAVLLGNSRSLFAFGTDGILPSGFARIHSRFGTPHYALTVSAAAASLCVLGCNFAGDFFLGVDLLVVSMLVNFLLMAIALLTFPRVNRELHANITFLNSRLAQVSVALAGIILLGSLVVVQIAGDVLSATAWYLKSTTNWVMVMVLGCVIYWRFWRRLRTRGINSRMQIFRELPPE